MLFLMWWGRWQWNHPVARILGFELDDFGLCDADENCVGRIPGDWGARPPSVPVMTNWLPWR